MDRNLTVGEVEIIEVSSEAGSGNEHVPHLDESSQKRQTVDYPSTSSATLDQGATIERPAVRKTCAYGVSPVGLGDQSSVSDSLTLVSRVSNSQVENEDDLPTCPSGPGLRSTGSVTQKTESRSTDPKSCQPSSADFFNPNVHSLGTSAKYGFGDAAPSAANSDTKEFTCTHDHWVPPSVYQTRSNIRKMKRFIALGLVMVDPETKMEVVEPINMAWNGFLEALLRLCSHAAQLPSTVFQCVSMAYDLALWVSVSLTSEPVLLEATDMLPITNTVDCPSCTYTKRLFFDAFESSAQLAVLLSKEASAKTLTFAETKSTFATHLRSILTCLGPLLSSAPETLQTNCIFWVCATMNRKWDVAVAKIDQAVKSICDRQLVDRHREVLVREWSQALELAFVLKNLRDVVSGVEKSSVNPVTETFRRCLRLKRSFDMKYDLFELVECILPEKFVDLFKNSKSSQARVPQDLDHLWDRLRTSFPANSDAVRSLFTLPNFSIPDLVNGVPYEPQASPISREWVEKAMPFRMHYAQCQQPGLVPLGTLLECLRTTLNVHSFLFGGRTIPNPQLNLQDKRHKAFIPERIMFLNQQMMWEVQDIVRSRSGPIRGPADVTRRLALSFIELDLKTMMIDVCLLLLAQFWRQPQIWGIYNPRGIMESTFSALVSVYRPNVGFEILDGLFCGLSHFCADGVGLKIKMVHTLLKKQLMHSPEISQSEDVVLNTGGIAKMKSDFFAAGFHMALPRKAIGKFLDIWLLRVLEMGEFARKCARFCVDNKTNSSLEALEEHFLAFSLVKLAELCEDCAKTFDVIPKGRIDDPDIEHSTTTTKLFQIFRLVPDSRVVSFSLRNVWSLVRLLRPLCREVLALSRKHVRGPDSRASLEREAHKLREKFQDIPPGCISILPAAAGVEPDQHTSYWANIIEDFALFVTDRSFENVSPDEKMSASSYFARWLRETSKMRSRVSVIELNISMRKKQTKEARPSNLDQSDCSKMAQSDCSKTLEIARLAASALIILKTGRVPPDPSGLPHIAPSIPAGSLSEMCICDAKNVLELVLSLLSRFHTVASTPENMIKLDLLTSQLKEEPLATMEAKFSKNLDALSKTWNSLMRSGDPHPPAPAPVAMSKVVIKAVPDGKAAAAVAPLHSSPLPPPMPARALPSVACPGLGSHPIRHTTPVPTPTPFAAMVPAVSPAGTVQRAPQPEGILVSVPPPSLWTLPPSMPPRPPLSAACLGVGSHPIPHSTPVHIPPPFHAMVHFPTTSLPPPMPTRAPGSSARPGLGTRPESDPIPDYTPVSIRPHLSTMVRSSPVVTVSSRVWQKQISKKSKFLWQKRRDQELCEARQAAAGVMGAVPTTTNSDCEATVESDTGPKGAVTPVHPTSLPPPISTLAPASSARPGLATTPEADPMSHPTPVLNHPVFSAMVPAESPTNSDSDTTVQRSISAVSSATKRKAKWGEFVRNKVSDVSSRTSATRLVQEVGDGSHTEPLEKVPRQNDDDDLAVLYWKIKRLEIEKSDFAAKVEAGQKATSELLTLIGQTPSETLEDALERLFRGARLVQRIDSDIFKKRPGQLEALAVEASELRQRGKCILDHLAAEKAELCRKLLIYRRLALQSPDSIANSSADDVSVVAHELRERIRRLRAVTLQGHHSVKAKQTLQLHAILQSSVARLAETESSSRLSVPDICKLFQNEVVPRFLLAQKLHKDMERRVLEAPALIEARDRRLAELGL